MSILDFHLSHHHCVEVAVEAADSACVTIEWISKHYTKAHCTHMDGWQKLLMFSI